MFTWNGEHAKAFICTTADVGVIFRTHAKNRLVSRGLRQTKNNDYKKFHISPVCGSRGNSPFNTAAGACGRLGLHDVTCIKSHDTL